MCHIHQKHEFYRIKDFLKYSKIMKGVKKLHNSITEAELVHKLCTIKKTLDKSKQEFFNLVFLDNECYFRFLNELVCPNGQTISDILNELEYCIPFSLTDDSFSLFMSSCSASDIEKMEALRRGFIQSCKNDFLLLLCHITDKEQWQHTIETCEQLRKKNRTTFKQKGLNKYDLQ